MEQCAHFLRQVGTYRQRLAFALIILVASGAAGFWYAAHPSGWGGLAIYAAGLMIAVFALSPVCAALDTRNDRKQANAVNETEADNSSRAQCEISQPSKALRRRPRLKQHAFDFDGMAALSARNSVDGAWLVAEASLAAIKTVREACRVAAPENGRIDRWFEIVLALNAARHASDEKAEVRRAEVAEDHGVSEEQTRQIDQGRYRPLNRILEQIDPADI